MRACTQSGYETLLRSRFGSDFKRLDETGFYVYNATDVVPSLPPYAAGFMHLGRGVYITRETLKALDISVINLLAAHERTGISRVLDYVQQLNRENMVKFNDSIFITNGRGEIFEIIGSGVDDDDVENAVDALLSLG